MDIRRILIWLLLSALSFDCPAEVFRWVDDQGRVQLGDRPPANVNAQSLDLHINTYSPPERSEARPAVASSVKPVVVYSTTWCGACKKAKSYLQARNIPYTEFDVERSEQGRRDYKRLDGKGVPLILVGESRMTGFSQSLFDQLYRPL